MAKISIDAIQDTSTSTGNKLPLFALKNHGEEALVRIMHDTVESFEIVTTHKVQVGQRYRNVNCLRDPHQPLDVCPLCKAGSKLQQRIYIHMLRYTVNAQGQIEVTPCVWDRPAGSYATKLKTLLNNYGPLSEVLFKVQRNGAAGSKDTTYELFMAPPANYNPNNYPKQDDAFKDYMAVGSIVLDKDANEMYQYLATGSFPQSNANTVNANMYPANPVATPNPVAAAPIPTAPIPSAPIPTGVVSSIPTTPIAPTPVAPVPPVTIDDITAINPAPPITPNTAVAPQTAPVTVDSAASPIPGVSTTGDVAAPSRPARFY